MPHLLTGMTNKKVCVVIKFNNYKGKMNFIPLGDKIDKDKVESYLLPSFSPLPYPIKQTRRFTN